MPNFYYNKRSKFSKIFTPPLFMESLPLEIEGKLDLLKFNSDQNKRRGSQL